MPTSTKPSVFHNRREFLLAHVGDSRHAYFSSVTLSVPDEPDVWQNCYVLAASEHQARQAVADEFVTVRKMKQSDLQAAMMAEIKG